MKNGAGHSRAVGPGRSGWRRRGQGARQRLTGRGEEGTRVWPQVQAQKDSEAGAMRERWGRGYRGRQLRAEDAGRGHGTKADDSGLSVGASRRHTYVLAVASQDPLYINSSVSGDWTVTDPQSQRAAYTQK